MAYWRLFYHFTWGTKGRLPLIQPSWMPNLYDVMAAKVGQLGAFVYAVGGIEDHVHLVAAVPPSLSLAQFVGQVKGSSSHWVNHVAGASMPFAWQEEYGVVSFGAKNLDFVARYVKDQAGHHQEGTTIHLMECVEPDGDPMSRTQCNEAPAQRC